MGDLNSQTMAAALVYLPSKLGKEVSRNHLDAKHVLPYPHCVTSVLSLPDNQDQLPLPGA